MWTRARGFINYNSKKKSHATLASVVYKILGKHEETTTTKKFMNIIHNRIDEWNIRLPISECVCIETVNCRHDKNRHFFVVAMNLKSILHYEHVVAIDASIGIEFHSLSRDTCTYSLTTKPIYRHVAFAIFTYLKQNRTKKKLVHRDRISLVGWQIQGK